MIGRTASDISPFYSLLPVRAFNFDSFDNYHNSFLWPEYFIDFLCERWIPCQAVTSVLCLHYRPETEQCSTKDAYNSEITFLILHPWFNLSDLAWIFTYPSVHIISLYWLLIKKTVSRKRFLQCIQICLKQSLIFLNLDIFQVCLPYEGVPVLRRMNYE